MSLRLTSDGTVLYGCNGLETVLQGPSSGCNVHVGKKPKSRPAIPGTPRTVSEDGMSKPRLAWLAPSAAGAKCG